MDGSEDAVQQLTGSWVRFELDQLLVEPVQVLVAFDKEVLNDVIHDFAPSLATLSLLFCSLEERQHRLHGAALEVIGRHTKNLRVVL